jgi:hypothetical protein
MPIPPTLMKVAAGSAIVVAGAVVWVVMLLAVIGVDIHFTGWGSN